MKPTIDFLLNHLNAVLIIFTVSAAAASIVTRSPAWRVAAGIAGLLVTLSVAISHRSLLEWVVSTVERPSLPGFMLLVVLAISAVTGRHVETSSEFRFGTMVLMLAGFVLYPASVGFLDYDTYAIGYGGYLLPAAVAAVLAYAIYRGYLLTAVALNLAIAAFLLGAGQSLNLWDYVMDPVAWIIGTGTWIGIAVGFLVARFGPAKALAQA